MEADDDFKDDSSVLSEDENVYRVEVRMDQCDDSIDDDEIELDKAVEEYQINEAIAEEMALCGSSSRSPDQGYGSQALEPVYMKSLIMDDTDLLDDDEENTLFNTPEEPPLKKLKRKYRCRHENTNNHFETFLTEYYFPSKEEIEMNKQFGVYENDTFDSNGRKRFKFMQLSQDVLTRVFKYLPISERAKAERIHPTFPAIMAHVWLRQRSLVVSFNPTFQNQFCSYKGHKFHFEDVFYDQEKNTSHVDRSFFKLLQKCPNIKNLFLLSNSVITKSFGYDLRKYCKNLEHIEIRDTATFVSFASYVSKKKCSQLKCIQLDDFDDEADEEIESAIVRVVKNCPKLDTFINNTIWNTEAVIKTVLPRVTDYRVNTLPNLNLLDLVTELGSDTLKSFGIREILPLERGELLIQKLVKMNQLEINIDGEELKLWYKTLSRLVRSGDRVPLQSLTLYPGHEYFDTKDNDYFFSNNGRHLKSLSLFSFQLRGASLRYIHQFCPDLEELRVYARQILEMKLWYKSLARLTRLKRLELKEAVMSGDEFRHVLNGLPNLKEIHLILFDFTSVIKSQLIAYARRHKPRIINVGLDFKLRQVAPHVVFGTQPVFSYDLCECHENIRFWYVH